MKRLEFSFFLISKLRDRHSPRPSWTENCDEVHEFLEYNSNIQFCLDYDDFVFGRFLHRLKKDRNWFKSKGTSKKFKKFSKNSQNLKLVTAIVMISRIWRKQDLKQATRWGPNSISMNVIKYWILNSLIYWSKSQNEKTLVFTNR